MSTQVTENRLTEKELQSVEEIKQQCIATLDYIEKIQNNDDVATNLGYVVHDWNNSAHRRNDEVMRHMKVLQDASSRIESEDAGN
jgi:hypothetical protein